MRARVLLSIAAAAAGAGCGASPPEASTSIVRETSAAPAPAPTEKERAAPAGDEGATSPPEDESATSLPGDGGSPLPKAPACRVATSALTCISAACFGRPDRKPGTGPSGFLPVHVRFDASGAIAAFEPEAAEGEAAAWREV